MRLTYRSISTLLVGLLLPTLTQFIPTDHSAFPPPKSYTFTIVSKNSVANQIGSQVFASCLIRTAGGTCTISKGKSIDRKVQLALGMSWSAATSQLSIGSGTTVTTTVSCTSPALAAGSTWRARSVGTKYFYKIRKNTVQAGHIIDTETSGQLSAFNPSASHIACGLQ